MMLRYFFIKLDLLRIKGQKLQATLYSTLFEETSLTDIVKILLRSKDGGSA